MIKKQQKVIEWFLRVSLSAGFLSAVADRFGLWPKDHSSWGNWDAFVKYTHSLIPFLSGNLASLAAITATVLEIFFAVLLLINYKTALISKLSGFLLLSFGICMVLFNYIKAPLDYSVFTTAAAAFALSIFSTKK